MTPAPPHVAPALWTATSANSAAVADLRVPVFALFFMFGGITSLNDVLIPKLKGLFALSYTEVMLVQSAFFIAYFIVSLPAAALVRRVGFMRTAAIGLLTMTAGCLLFIPGSSFGVFPAFLGALFVLASGITIVQVVANPLISMLGSPATAPSRLTFAQAFNSLGTTIFPYVGSTLILGSLSSVDQSKLVDGALLAFRAQESSVVAETYLGLAVILAIGAVLVWLGRNRLVEAPAELVAEPTTIMRAFDLLARPRFGFGALAIFLYVGAEVSVGSVLASWLMRADTLGLVAERAGKMVALYWGGAMIGRFVGAAVLRRVSPPLALAGVAVAASVLLVAAGASDGAIAGWSMIAIGLCNSIMFPTIFSLASTGLGRRAAEGSGIICMAIVGGAVVPLITGAVADAEGLRLALGVPMLCYLVIAGFAFACLRLAVPADDPVPVTAA